MYTFEQNFDALVRQSVGEALAKLEKGDQAYAKQEERWSYLSRALQEYCMETDSEPDSRFKEMMTDFIELNFKVRMDRNKAIYLRGCMDCIRMLSRYGWLCQPQ